MTRDAQKPAKDAQTPGSDHTADPRSDLDAEGYQEQDGDTLGQRSAGPADDSAGSGITGLGGSQGGTPNYSGVGVPGGARPLGGGNATDAGQQATGAGVPATGGLSAPPNAERGQGSVIGSTVLPGGATRPNAPQDSELGDSQMKNGSDYQTRDSGQAAPSSPQPNPTHGTGAGDAANDVAEGGAEAATLERHGHRPTIAGSAAPMNPPPAPETENPYGGSQSESAANPLQEGAIPQQPTPGVTREPGPEAQH